MQDILNQVYSSSNLKAAQNDFEDTPGQKTIGKVRPQFLIMFNIDSMSKHPPEAQRIGSLCSDKRD